MVTQQLQEQLQANVIQQGFLLRHHDQLKNVPQMHQLQLQQQHILAQLQWVQQNNGNSSSSNNHNDQLTTESQLLMDGCCQWPGCEKSQFSNKATFWLHLNSEHSLSHNSAAQVNIKNYFQLGLLKITTNKYN
jgi:hypothetical protein